MVLLEVGAGVGVVVLLVALLEAGAGGGVEVVLSAVTGTVGGGVAPAVKGSVGMHMQSAGAHKMIFSPALKNELCTTHRFAVWLLLITQTPRQEICCPSLCLSTLPRIRPKLDIMCASGIDTPAGQNPQSHQQ